MGRTALVTGGGQGVGQGIARAMAKAGADIVIAQRRGEEAEREAAWIRENTGVRAFALSVDVTDDEAVNAMIRQAHEQLGKLEILVNNAGGSFAKRLENHSDEDMASGFDLNYWSVFRAMRAASPTGGALGAVSDSENAMLAAKAGALDPSSPNFARDLDDYELTLLKIVHGPEAGQKIF